MEPERTDRSALPDRELNEALESNEELDGLSLEHQRLARIQEYEELALAQSDPLTAVLGMGTSYLAQLFDHVGQAVLVEFETQTPTLTSVREVAPEIHLLLKMRSAIEADRKFRCQVLGEPPLALPRNRNNGMLDKQAARHARGLVPQCRRSNA